MSLSLRVTAAASAAALLPLSNQALAGNPFGTITFSVLDTSTPFVPVPVPTLGILAAVMLIGGLLVVALHALRKNQHTFASLAGLGALLSAALTAGSIGVLQAGSVQTVSIDEENLGPFTFDCDEVTVYINDSTSAVFVSALTLTAGCNLGSSTTTCEVTEPPIAIEPSESCAVGPDAS